MITEASEPIGMWAWKIKNGDGTVSYIELKGDVRLENVTFGYVENKTVLEFPCMQSPVRKLLLSDPPEREKLRYKLNKPLLRCS